METGVSQLGALNGLLERGADLAPGATPRAAEEESGSLRRVGL
jgi:hypothetical protein